MIFKEANGVTDWSELLEIIEYNYAKSSKLEKDVRKLKIKPKEVKNIKKAAKKVKVEKSSSYDNWKQDSLFEDELSFYLDGYKNLDVDFTKEDLVEILPLSKDYNYQRVVVRLMSESMKEMKEIHEFLTLSDDLTESELLELKRMILHEDRKLTMLRGIFDAKVEESFESPTKNNLILVPNSGGKIRVIDELEHLPRESYQDFLKLINSIVDGTFKGVKRFCNNDALKGLCEVKSVNGERVLFVKLNQDSYAIISAFVKKTDRDKGYADALKRKLADYRDIEDSLKGALDNDDFLHDNDLYVQKLFNLLNPVDKLKKI